MKRNVLAVAAVLLAGAMAFAQGTSEASAPKEAEKPMSHDELVAAAQKEGTLTIYTHSSRTAKAAAGFTEQYGIKVDVTQLKDSEMIDKVSKEAAADLDGADLIFCQDGSRVYPELLMAGYVQNYIPPTRADQVDPKYSDPLVWEFITKLFIYNNEKAGSPITNVWQLTEPEFKGRLQFKDPFSEGVNMNFFTMVTNDAWSQKLADAYKAEFGKDIVLKSDEKNAGYAWIRGLYENGAVLGKSDTTLAENVGAKGQDTQLIALITSNKLRTAAAKNLALDIAHPTPFSGFMYPAYMFITKNAKSPNAAKLYAEYAMTADGFKPFDTQGDYSPVLDISKNVEDGMTVADWEKELVVEDPQWCAEARPDVEEFISKLL